MKNRTIGIILGLCLVAGGCDFLDVDESSGKTKELAYASFSELSNGVTGVYSGLRSDWGVLGGALRESATDNAVYTWEKSAVYRMYENTWSPLNLVDDCWAHYYSSIRAANVFLANFDLEKVKRFEHNLDYKVNLEKAKLYPDEVRFLRAYYFFELAKYYGDVPLLTEIHTKESINSVERTPFEKVIRFVVDECDAVRDRLPVNHREFYKETGRATKGAAMALKSRALLYAASPLHNEAGDPGKWEAAARAAGDLIDAGIYKLVKGEPLFGVGDELLASKQLIFERRETASNSFEAANLPIGFEKAKSGNTPTQNLVDAFEMADGTEFDWNNPAHVRDPYADRDPRLARTVVTNNSSIMGRKVETFFGGANARPLEGATKTGYYLRKYIDETTSQNPITPVKKNHHFVLFRYAEILLNYAEALNECKGPDYKDDVFKLSAREALNQVRACAGMPEVTVTGQAAFRERVRRERRVELAFEDHRFWDIRRWKTGGVVRDIYGVEIARNADGTFTYDRKKIQTRVWDDKMYLYPLPMTEIYNNGNLAQNPGW